MGILFRRLYFSNFGLFLFGNTVPKNHFPICVYFYMRILSPKLLLFFSFFLYFYLGILFPKNIFFNLCLFMVSICKIGQAFFAWIYWKILAQKPRIPFGNNIPIFCAYHFKTICINDNKSRCNWLWRIFGEFKFNGGGKSEEKEEV